MQGAKSVFQIGGAGAVGTGSLRGMPCLLDLKKAGFHIWPFDPPGFPLVLEIYPRALLRRRVNKSRWRDRHKYLCDEFQDQPRALLERAAGSEDAFDATVSALVMSRHEESFDTLPVADEIHRIEGQIWKPAAAVDLSPHGGQIDQSGVAPRSG